MTLTPAIKGQLTKARKDYGATIVVFMRHMPRQQAKHATRKLLAS